MRTEEIKIFEFNELSEAAQQKVLRDYCDINVNFDWWHFAFDDAEIVNLKISGFDLDREWSIDIDPLSSIEEVLSAIIEEHGQSTDTAKLARQYSEKLNTLNSRLIRVQNTLNEIDRLFPGYWDPESVPHKYVDLYEYCEELEAEIEECIEELEDDFIHEIGQCYLTILRNEYEWRISEEAIIETIEANEYEFTEDGNQF